MSNEGDAPRRLEEHLRLSGLQLGDRLLPERRLAALLGLSRRALREALQRLEVQGRIWRGVGQGTFLGARPPSAARPAAMRPSAADPLAVMEARLALEPALAALAAVKAEPADIEQILRCARRGAETRDEDSWGEWDAAFHRAVAAACRNALLRDAFERLEACRAGTAWGRLRGVVATATLRRQAAAEHQAIAEALAARDPAGAHRAMREHLHAVQQAILRAGAAAGAADQATAADAA